VRKASGKSFSLLKDTGWEGGERGGGASAASAAAAAAAGGGRRVVVDCWLACLVKTSEVEVSFEESGEKFLAAVRALDEFKPSAMGQRPPIFLRKKK
jgi:hypothetical protein